MAAIEYQTIVTKNDSANRILPDRSEKLKDLGSKGWQLVSTVALTNPAGTYWEGRILDTLSREIQ